MHTRSTLQERRPAWSAATGVLIAILALALACTTLLCPLARADSPGELVDRGSKLAFQIAMEVARLGPRGERLLPMTQALEELWKRLDPDGDHHNFHSDVPVAISYHSYSALVLWPWGYTISDFSGLWTRIWDESFPWKGRSACSLS